MQCHIYYTVLFKQFIYEVKKQSQNETIKEQNFNKYLQKKQFISHLVSQLMFFFIIFTQLTVMC